MTAYQIRDWAKHFENYKSRERDKCRFVCMPNKQDGAGLSRILASPNGASYFGIWCLVIQRASKQPRPRDGWLTDDGTDAGRAWDLTEIAYLWRQDINLIKDALALFSSSRVGWMTAGEAYTQSAQVSDKYPAQTPSGVLHHPEVPPVGTEVPRGVLGTPKVSYEGMKEEEKTGSHTLGLDWRTHRPADLPRALSRTWDQIAQEHGGTIANAALQAARRIYGATVNHGQLSATYQTAHRDGALDLDPVLWSNPKAKVERPQVADASGYPTLSYEEQLRIIKEMDLFKDVGPDGFYTPEAEARMLAEREAAQIAQ